MKLKTYVVQRTYAEKLNSVRNLSRVGYDLLTSQLSFPLIWWHDKLLDTWLPAEATPNLTHFLRQGQNLAEREQQIQRVGLIEVLQDPPELLRTRFKADGYVIIKNLFPAAYCRDTIARQFYQNEHLQERHPDMPGISRCSINNLPIIRLLHQATEKLVNFIVEEPVKTSYSFTALYDHQSCLPKHTDRKQCVYNISLMLDASPRSVDLTTWPLFISVDEKVSEIKLEPGDAVLYSGTKDPHWRDQLPPTTETVLGTFFHYVPKDFTGSLD